MDPRDSHLSPLPGRRELEALLLNQAAGAFARGDPIALILIDIDGFKRVNDSCGYRVGDAVLLECAHRLASIPEGVGMVFQYGGEELVLVLPGHPMPDVARLSQRIQVAIGEPSEVPGAHGLRLSATIHVAMLPGDGATA